MSAPAQCHLPILLARSFHLFFFHQPWVFPPSISSSHYLPSTTSTRIYQESRLQLCKISLSLRGKAFEILIMDAYVFAIVSNNRF